MVNNFQSGDSLTQKKTQNLDKKTRNDVQYLNFGEEDKMDIQGFALSKLKCHICQLSYVLTLGLLRLFFHWFPYLHLLATHDKGSLKDADTVLITDSYHKNKTYFIKPVKILESQNLPNGRKKMLKYRLCDGEIKESEKIKIIRCKKLTYVWEEKKLKFLKLTGLQNGVTKAHLHGYYGLSIEDQFKQKIVYGPNEINIPIQTVLELLILEALTPFYIFQLFSLTVWLCENYYYYGVAIVVMTVFGISSSIIQTRKNQQNLKGTVHTSDKAIVYRKDGTTEEISTSDLVPGDVIIIPKYGCNMNCDAVLISGSCIVNESMLTGESVPVTKTSLPNEETLYSVKEDVNHTLFCGTRVIQTRCQGSEILKAVVIKTGYLTTKGELVRSILYPPPADFKFDQDSYKYIVILSCIATLGFVWTVASKASRHIAVIEIVIKALDIFTIVIPPALPAAMTVGKLYALNRLKAHNIFCINSRVINVSGSVDCVCFDKTGTLTEDALDLWAVVPITHATTDKPVRDVKQLSNDSSLFRAMTSCHTLTLIDGEICGDPLDVKMFESTSWSTEETNGTTDLQAKYGQFKPLTIMRSPLEWDNEQDEIAIVKQFQFSSNLQRMSVICKSPKNRHLEIFCKGSPEKIISLSNQNTVPEDIHDTLKLFTKQGYRVIAVGAKRVEGDRNTNVEDIKRDDVEINLNFIGMIVLENKLKPETVGVINVLKDAEIKIVMITGDNLQTAITVAKECKIVNEAYKIIEVETTKPNKTEFASIKYRLSTDSSNNLRSNSASTNKKHVDLESPQDKDYCFVITGENWANVVKYFPDIVPKIVTKGAVFARMSGLQKQEVIEALKTLGYYVAMCGDGSNDCSALKAAHVGISLSEAEASIASPFTSKEQNISCTPKVIKEGRAALVTSFGVFKIMLCYSLTEFTSTLILYTLDSNLSSMQFLYIDIILILNLMFSFGRTKAYDKLSKKPPRTSILSFVPLSSMTLFLLITTGFQVFAFLYVHTYDWFTPFVYKPDVDINLNNISFEGYAVFCVSMFQYITLNIVFSKGKPYRKPIFTNKIFVTSLFFTTLLCIYVTLYPADFISSILQLKMPPFVSGRLFVLWISLLHFLICIFVEDYFVQRFLENFVAPKVTKSKKLYLKIIDSLRKENNWPKVYNFSESCIVANFCENSKRGAINKGYVSSDL